MMPNTREGYDLLHRGAVALADVECNGIVIDVDYVKKALKKTRSRVEKIERRIMDTDVAKAWLKKYGSKMNLRSNAQLGDILFNVMKFPAPDKTGSGQHKADEDALNQIDDPFIPKYIRMNKLEAACDRNFKNILQEVSGNKVHCFFNLHKVISYRSSSDSFNFQNIPKHDPEIGELVRRSFIARPGRQLVEIDFKGAEVCSAACYNHDPNLITYIKDKTKDMHRDTAMDLYRLPIDQVSDAIRYSAKNGFVFAEFYGDWYVSCAKRLWKLYVTDPNNMTTDGVTLLDHLKSVGVSKLGALDSKQRPKSGTFEELVKKTEESFWNLRFRVYSQWKKSWYEKYQKLGYFETLTGFVCRGYMSRNDVINYPVQGTAFHWLLWSMIEIMAEMRRRGMKSLIVGQIHDSIVADVVPEELDEFLHLCRVEVIGKMLPKKYPWINVPIVTDVEVAPVGGTWADKAKYKGAA